MCGLNGTFNSISVISRHFPHGTNYIAAKLERSCRKHMTETSHPVTLSVDKQCFLALIHTTKRSYRTMGIFIKRKTCQTEFKGITDTIFLQPLVVAARYRTASGRRRFLYTCGRSTSKILRPVMTNSAAAINRLTHGILRGK